MKTINVKSFLISRDQRIIREIKKMKEEYNGGLERFEEEEGFDMKKLVFAYNQAIDDVINLLENR